MKAKATVLLGLKVIILAFILFGLYSIDFLGLGLVEETQTAPTSLLLVSLLHAAVLSWPILRSRWTGWRLVAAIFLVFYGVTTLMVAIEAVYLPEALPLDLVVRLVVNGAITAAVFSVLAVLIHGRMSRGEEPQETNLRLIMPWTQWVWKLALIGFSWVVLFILFGALVFLPLAGRLAPAALEEYTNMEMPAWILPFQALRAVLWAALTLPVIRMMREPALPVPSVAEGSLSKEPALSLPKGRWWETGLAVALLFSVLMGANLLRPTGLPVGLQVAHLVEVFGENLLFGWIVVWLLHRRHGRNVPATA